LFMAARGRRECSRSSTRRGSREYATTPASMPPPLRHLSRKPRYSGGSARHSNLGFRRSTRVPATAFGASRSLPRVSAKVASPKRQRPLRLGGRNRSSCPNPAIPLVERRWFSWWIADLTNHVANCQVAPFPGLPVFGRELRAIAVIPPARRILSLCGG
jgi:hypothetical protein